MNRKSKILDNLMTRFSLKNIILVTVGFPTVIALFFIGQQAFDLVKGRLLADQLLISNFEMDKLSLRMQSNFTNFSNKQKNEMQLISDYKNFHIFGFQQNQSFEVQSEIGNVGTFKPYIFKQVLEEKIFSAINFNGNVYQLFDLQNQKHLLKNTSEKLLEESMLVGLKYMTDEAVMKILTIDHKPDDILMIVASQNGDLIYSNSPEVNNANFAAMPVVQQYLKEPLKNSQVQIKTAEGETIFGYFRGIQGTNLILFSQITEAKILQPYFNFVRSFVYICLVIIFPISSSQRNTATKSYLVRCSPVKTSHWS